ncbi:TetR/AcrR family transcriptional regulator [Mycobacterium sp. SMC-8]|uniref:TetR/AcrR family transcriptional regulator n=1 Tax=Mycobacterium sp. SMC-8 TaxID=2857060 RepID=UPI0021B1BF3A|nr:TetR/AcrR family transcriptional regulator [Mycobacterium sp. SMC-8]UXA11512.1 TetR/AcrR family transcriptional regulator [Mycobacterium sp. SMC-8]
MRPGDRPRLHAGTSDAERQILLATERLLESTPLTELSVASILKEAGVSRTTFYFYFSSKYAPVTALLSSVMDQIFEQVSLFTSGADSGDDANRLEKGLEGATQLFREHRMVFRATVEHWHSVAEIGELWLKVIERFTDAFASEIERERAAGTAPPGIPSRELAAGLIWASERLLYVAGLGVDADLPDEDRALASLLAIWQGAVYGSAPNPLNVNTSP